MKSHSQHVGYRTKPRTLKLVSIFAVFLVAASALMAGFGASNATHSTSPASPARPALGNPAGIGRVIATVDVGINPVAGIDMGNLADMAMVNEGSNNISLIRDSTNQVVGSDSTGIGPSSATFNSSQDHFYTTNGGSNNLSIVLNNLPLRTTGNISSGFDIPSASALDSSDGVLYVANYVNNTVSVVNLSDNTVGKWIKVGTQPIAMSFDQWNGLLYVSNHGGNNVTVINPKTNQTIASILVGSTPEGILVSSSKDLYIANYGSNNVSVVNPAINRSVWTIPVGSSPRGLVFAVGSGYIYVTNFASDNVSVIDPTTNETIGAIPVGSNPSFPVFSTVNDNVYVPNSGSSNVSVIATLLYNVTFVESWLKPGTLWQVTLNGVTNSSTSNNITFQVPYGTFSYSVGNVPGYFASPTSGSVMVSGTTSVAIRFSTVAAGKLSATISGLNQPTGGVFNPLNETVFITDSGGNDVSILNGSTNVVMGKISIPTGSYGATYDTLNRYIYVVSNGARGNVTAINASTGAVVATIPVGDNPYAIAFDPVNGFLYVPNEGSDNVSVINGSNNSVVKTLNVSLEPEGAVYDPLNGYIFVTNFFSNNISLINGTTNSIVGSTPTLFTSPMWPAYDPYNGYIYVPDYGSNNVSVINATTIALVESIPVGGGPQGVVFDPSNGFIYVTNSGSDNVSTINGSSNTVVANFNVGTTPLMPVYDSYNGNIYVPNINSNNVSVISSLEYRVNFSESGTSLPDTWYVNLTDGKSFSSTSQNFTELLQNGTYYYSVGSANKSAYDAGGSFTISGPGKTVYIVFAALSYAVYFNETGINNASVTWYLNVSGGPKISGAAVPGNTLTLYLLNGTYTYTVATDDKEYAPAPGEGTFTVHGKSPNLIVKFALFNYSGTFTESNLPSGSNWYVNITGTQQDGTPHSAESGAITGSSYTSSIPNGTYTYYVSTGDKEYRPLAYSGAYLVSAVAPDESTAFMKNVYSSAFGETGLGSGKWYINITGTTEDGSSFNLQSGGLSGTAYNTTLPNGTYTYSISSGNKIYAPGSYSGSVTVNGASPAQVSVKFTEVVHTITFTEAGLPAGTNWSVTLGGQTISSTNTTITFTEPNGTYDYTITGIPNYGSNVTSGNVSVNGVTISKSVSFTQKSSPPVGPGFMIIMIILVFAVVVIVASLLILKKKGIILSGGTKK